jgi:hypothetical protein
VLPRKLESLAYTAVIAFFPTGNAEVVKLAEPSFNAPGPSSVVPFINETVSPSGGIPALELTAAVNVTPSPEVDGFSEEVSVIVVEVSTKP